MINFDKSFKRNCDMTGILLTTNRKQKGLRKVYELKYFLYIRNHP